MGMLKNAEHYAGSDLSIVINLYKHHTTPVQLRRGNVNDTSSSQMTMMTTEDYCINTRPSLLKTNSIVICKPRPLPKDALRSNGGS
jgi:hypothetical protein